MCIKFGLHFEYDDEDVNYIRFHRNISIYSWNIFGFWTWASIKIDVCKNVGYIERFKRDDEVRQR